MLSGLHRGGIETFIMNVFKNINREEIQFDFLITDGTETDYSSFIRKNGGKIYTYTSRKKNLYKSCKDLFCFFKSHKEYRIIHVHVSSLTDITPLLIAKLEGVPVRIIHSHNTQQGGIWIHKYIHQINKLFIHKFATHYFACSLPAAQWMFNSVIIRKGLYRIIPNAIDLSSYKFDIRQRLLSRRKYKLNEDDPVIVNVGRLHPQKNQIFLLKIIYELKKILPNIRLLIAGKGHLFYDLNKVIKKFNLNDNVYLCGEIKNVSELLSASDLFCLPSLYEGLGIVLIEAQASGLPCVVSDKVPLEAKVLESFTYIPLEKDASYWAEIIASRLKLKDKSRTPLMDVFENYDITICSKRLQNFYKYVI